jgi:serine protease AprX
VYARDFFAFKKALKKEGKDFFEFPFISAFGIKLESKEIVTMAKNKVVLYITKNAEVSALCNVGKRVLNVDSFYTRGFDGDGGVVAVIDTGIFPHIDFVVPKNRILKFVDFVNNRKTPYDDNGHGTMVASIICGSGLLYNKKYAGVSPKSQVIALKAIESSGETTTAKILEAMQWVYDNRRKYNISVVCMSFGSDPTDSYDPLSVGAESLWNAGICVVAAAGNSGPSSESIKTPGISQKILTVGGIDDKRDNNDIMQERFEVADFSSRGPVGGIYKPDLVAPAVGIVGASNNGGYTIMSGTSVATPFIAGVASLLMAKYPKLTPDQIKIRLVKCCHKITKDQNADGFGLLDCNRLFI